MVEESSSTLRLVHFTLQEYLLSDPTLFHSPHSTIAEVCLTYLNFGCVQDLSPTLRSAPATMPLLEYASLNWAKHARKEMTKDVKILALRLLDKFDEHISAQLLLSQYKRCGHFQPHFNSEKGPIGFTGLHGTAFLGIVELLAAVLEMKEWDVNARGIVSLTPLLWAATQGHEGVVKALLERGDINPDLADHRLHPTPLSWAALEGHERVVKVFLEQEGVNPDGAGTLNGYTPLPPASLYGHAGTVKMSLEREDVNPNRVFTLLGTPLLVAVGYGHEGVVKMLLEREDTNPNLVSTVFGHTPLSYAAKRGREGIVKMLLERNDIRIDIQDNKNQTPLSLALSQGHNKIARIISARASARSNTPAPSGQASPPPSTQHREEHVEETQPRGDHPNTNTADSTSQPPPPPADPNTPEGAPDCKGPFANSTDSIIPSTEPLSPPRPLPPPEFWHSPGQITTPPNNTPSTLPITAHPHFIITSFVCILAFLLYILPFSLQDMFSSKR